MASDTSFGPGTGASFDFTLLFDHAILSIIPSALMILLAPVFILHYRRQTEVILASALLWNKIVSFGFDASNALKIILTQSWAGLLYVTPRSSGRKLSALEHFPGAPHRSFHFCSVPCMRRDLTPRFVA